VTAPVRGRLRIAHLFPDLLNVYGDGGNVQTLVTRCAARGIVAELETVCYGTRTVPCADLFLIGGGQDKEQVTVARELERVGGALEAELARGAALLAVCGGYQNLGRVIRARRGDLPGPGVLPISTDVRSLGPRLVGPIVISAPDAVADLGRRGAAAAGVPGAERSIVGFENHGGRTYLDDGGAPLGRVEHGWGNNGTDGGEGVAVAPDPRGIPTRIGTYLHGPLLPRNPHVADALIAAALARGGEPPELMPLDDRLEWQAHEQFARRIRAVAAAERRLPQWAHRMVDPLRSLVGF
jgi:lipid II isoglutaminyl synthase (glutamine-hydrolysing)